MVKTRITVTVDEETDLRIRENLRLDDNMRNKSHFVELAIKEFLERKCEE